MLGAQLVVVSDAHLGNQVQEITRRQELADKKFVVAINDQAGQAIRFAENQPASATRIE